MSETLETIISSNPKDTILKKDSFFNHVFDLSEESKAEYMNIIQYILLAIIPIIILNKFVGIVIPPLEDDKGSIELIMEVLGQVFIVMIGIILINKGIQYLPTYSGLAYRNINISTLVPVFLIIMLSLQTKIGQKANEVIERVIDAISMRFGMDSDKTAESKKTNKTQPQQSQNKMGRYNTNAAISQHQMSSQVMAQPPQPIATSVSKQNDMSQSQPMHQNSRSDYGSQNAPDFNAMYAGPNITLQDSNVPTEHNNSGIANELLGESGPMAANSVLGGSFGSSF